MWTQGTVPLFLVGNPALVNDVVTMLNKQSTYPPCFKLHKQWAVADVSTRSYEDALLQISPLTPLICSAMLVMDSQKAPATPLRLKAGK